MPLSTEKDQNERTDPLHFLVEVGIDHIVPINQEPDRYYTMIEEGLERIKEEFPLFNFAMVGTGDAKLDEVKQTDEYQEIMQRVTPETLVSVNTHGSRDKDGKLFLDGLTPADQHFASLPNSAGVCHNGCYAGDPIPPNLSTSGEQGILASGNHAMIAGFASPNYSIRMISSIENTLHLARRRAERSQMGTSESKENSLIDQFSGHLNNASTRYFHFPDTKEQGSMKFETPDFLDFSIEERLSQNQLNERLKDHIAKKLTIQLTEAYAKQDLGPLPDTQQITAENITNKYLNETLIEYASHGKTEGVNMLLKCGVQPDAKDGDNLTALDHALRLGRSEVVESILSLSSEEQKQSLFQQSTPDALPPLHFAMKNGMPDLAKLIDAGASLEQTDNKGQTPLWYAVPSQQGGPRINRQEFNRFIDKIGIKKLLDQRNNEGKTFLNHVAENPAYTAHYNKLDSIVEREDFQEHIESYTNLDNSDNLQFIHTLAKERMYAVETAALIEHISPDQLKTEDSNRCNALYHATASGNRPVMGELLKEGQPDEQMTVRDNKGNNLFHISTRHDQQIIQRLKQSNSDILHDLLLQKNYETEETPLHLSARNGNVGVSSELLEVGNQEAQLSAQNKDNNTPLHLVCSGFTSDPQSGDKYTAPQTRMITMFVEKGGKELMSAENKQGQTPLDIALDNNLAEQAEQLIFHGATPPSATSSFQKQGLHGETMLHWTAIKKHTNVMEHALKNLKPNEKEKLLNNIKDIGGQSVTDKAIKSKDPDLLKVMLKHGDDTTKQTILQAISQDKTTMNEVFKRSMADGDTQIAETLLHHGASTDKDTPITTTDKKGNNVLHYAAQNGHDDVVNKLAEHVKQHGKGPELFEAKNQKGLAPMSMALKKDMNTRQFTSSELMQRHMDHPKISGRSQTPSHAPITPHPTPGQRETGQQQR